MMLHNPHFSGSVKLAPAITHTYPADLAAAIQSIQNAETHIKGWPDNVEVEINMDNAFPGDAYTGNAHPQASLKNTEFPDLEAAVNNQHYKQAGLPNYVSQVIETVTSYFEKKSDVPSPKVTMDGDVICGFFNEQLGEIRKYLETVEADGTLLPNAKIHFMMKKVPSSDHLTVWSSLTPEIRIAGHGYMQLSNTHVLPFESPLGYVKRIVAETQKLSEVLI